MESNTLISRELVLEREDRSRQSIVVRIGTPYWVSENNEAACPVQIDGLYNKLADVHGIDLYQSVQLAMQLVDMLLSSAAGKRQRLLWANGERFDLVTRAQRKAPGRTRKVAKTRRIAARKK